MRCRHVLSLAAALAVASCGFEEPLTTIVESAERSIVLATLQQIKDGKVVPNSYIVTFRSESPALRFYASAFSEYQARYAPLAERFMSDPRVVDIHYIDEVDLGSLKGPSAQEDLNPPPAVRFAFDSNSTAPILATIAEVTFQSNDEAASALKEWDDDHRIWFAEPNGESELYDDDIQVFTDLEAQYKKGGDNFWWHKNINLYAAYKTIADRKAPVDLDLSNPVIAVLDSGVDTKHPAFEGRLFKNPSPGITGCPNDENGCDTTKITKGTFGLGFTRPFKSDANNRCIDDKATKGVCQHGSHVAGIIAAKFDNDVGGVCPFCQIMPVKIIADDTGKAADSAILNAMKYITRFTRRNRSVVRVINSSFGTYVRSRSVGVLVNVLSAAPNEVLVVGAASNEDSMQRAYPAAYNESIAVSALDEIFQKSTYSNYGPWVDIAAPGGDGSDKDPVSGKPQRPIVSVASGEKSVGKNGTSMACPVVAGAAGLILTVDPGRSRKDLRSSLVLGADPSIYNEDVALGANRQNYYIKVQGDNTRRPLLGSGVLNVDNALRGEKMGLTPGGIARVTSGCSTVGGTRAAGSALGLLLMMFPVLYARRLATRAGPAGLPGFLARRARSRPAGAF